jgi:hypothetical protein
MRNGGNDMKLGGIDVKSPLSGGSISLNPGNLVSLVFGGALLMILFGFSKTISNMAASKLPGRLSNYGAAPTVSDPYGGLIVHQ